MMEIDKRNKKEINYFTVKHEGQLYKVTETISNKHGTNFHDFKIQPSLSNQIKSSIIEAIMKKYYLKNGDVNGN